MATVSGMRPHPFHLRPSALFILLAFVSIRCMARDPASEAKRNDGSEVTISVDTVKARGSTLCLKSRAGYGLLLSSLHCGEGRCTFVKSVGAQPGPNRVGIYAKAVPQNSLDSALRLATLSMRLDTGRLKVDMPTFSFKLGDTSIARQLWNRPPPVWARRLAIWSSTMESRMAAKASAVWTDSLALASSGNASNRSVRLKLESGTDVRNWLGNRAELTVYGSNGPVPGDPYRSFETRSTDTVSGKCVQDLLSGKVCEAVLKTGSPWVQARLRGQPQATKNVDASGCFDGGFELWTAWAKRTP